MRSFGKYISKHLVSFVILILVILFINLITFGLTFYKTLEEDYGETSPQIMLETASKTASPAGISEETVQKLRQDNIWAIYLNKNGQCLWSLDLPDEVPKNYTIQDVALFSRGYIANYPVFIRNTDDGLLILGYPKDSYTKLISNYYSVHAIRKLPFYITGMLAVDLLLLFCAYYFSKRNMIRNTEPIATAIESLANARPTALTIHGELSEIAESINDASAILSRQNEARANWISGVSHDIRTPLSMIMGYAEHISCSDEASDTIKKQAEIIRRQSARIKDLIRDLNLVSQLEYEMQPLNKKEIRIAKFLRSYVAELLNTGVSDIHPIDLDIAQDAEFITLKCDERLLLRAIDNLVQNSINHNPQGCEITLRLAYSNGMISIIVEDNGIGLSPEKLSESEKRPHYMESTDERLDLRHGLGLLLVRRILSAHDGTMQIESSPEKGYKTKILLPVKK